MEIADIERRLGFDLPEACKAVMRVLEWPSEDGTLVEPVLILDETSPVSEAEIGCFYPALEWVERIAEVESCYRDWAKGLDVPIRAIGPVKPEFYGDKRVYLYNSSPMNNRAHPYTARPIG